MTTIELNSIQSSDVSSVAEQEGGKPRTRGKDDGPTTLPHLEHLVHITRKVQRPMLLRVLLESAHGQVLPAAQALTDAAKNISARGGELVSTVLGSVMGVFSMLALVVIVPVVAFYLLLDWDSQKIWAWENDNFSLKWDLAKSGLEKSYSGNPFIQNGSLWLYGNQTDETERAEL